MFFVFFSCIDTDEALVLEISISVNQTFNYKNECGGLYFCTGSHLLKNIRIKAREICEPEKLSSVYNVLN